MKDQQVLMKREEHLDRCDRRPKMPVVVDVCCSSEAQNLARQRLIDSHESESAWTQ